MEKYGKIWEWREEVIKIIEAFFDGWSVGKDDELDKFMDSLWASFPTYMLPNKEDQCIKIYLPNSEYVMEYWFRPHQMTWKEAILSYVILPRRITGEGLYTYMFFQNKIYLKQAVASAQMGNILGINTLAIWTLQFSLPKVNKQIVNYCESRLDEPNPIIRGHYLMYLGRGTDAFESFKEDWNHPLVRFLYMTQTGEYYFDDIEEHFSAICVATNCPHNRWEEDKHPYYPIFKLPAETKKQQKAISKKLRELGSNVMANAYNGKYTVDHGYSKGDMRRLDQNITNALQVGFHPKRDIYSQYYGVSVAVLVVLIAMFWMIAY